MSVLDIVVPGLLGPFSSVLPDYIPADLQQPEFKKLNKWLSRAKVSTQTASTYYATLQSLICPQCNLSVCQLTAEYDRVENTQGHLYRIDPVHFKAESDHAILLGSQLLDVALSEAEELIAAFNIHFAEDAISLHLGAADRWYLQAHRPLQLTFNSIDYSLGRDIKHFMPQGDDALWWRKILNEAQMLFFQHAVNQAREDSRQLTINGLWLWDDTFTINNDLLADYQSVYTDDGFVSALANQAGVNVSPAAEIYNTSMQEFSGNNLLVVDEIYEAVCYGDVDAWLKSVRLFCETHFVTIQNLLDSKKVSAINIYPCDGRVFYIDHWQLLKFWKTLNSLDVYVTRDAN